MAPIGSIQRIFILPRFNWRKAPLSLYHSLGGEITALGQSLNWHWFWQMQMRLSSPAKLFYCLQTGILQGRWLFNNPFRKLLLWNRESLSTLSRRDKKRRWNPRASATTATSSIKLQWWARARLERPASPTNFWPTSFCPTCTTLWWTHTSSTITSKKSSTHSIFLIRPVTSARHHPRTSAQSPNTPCTNHRTHLITIATPTLHQSTPAPCNEQLVWVRAAEKITFTSTPPPRPDSFQVRSSMYFCRRSGSSRTKPFYSCSALTTRSLFRKFPTH